MFPTLLCTLFPALTPAWSAPAPAPSPHLARAVHATADLDQDGRTEQLTVGFGEGEAIVVEIAAPGRAPTRLDLGPRGDIFGPRTELSISTTKAADTGIPLLKLFIPGGEYCGSGDTTLYVSFTDAQARLALELRQWSDAPVWSHTEAAFHPATRTVTLDTRTGNEESTHRTFEVRALVDGVFVAP